MRVQNNPLELDVVLQRESLWWLTECSLLRTTFPWWWIYSQGLEIFCGGTILAHEKENTYPAAPSSLMDAIYNLFAFTYIKAGFRLCKFFLSFFVWKYRGYIHLLLIPYELLDNLLEGRNQPVWRARAASSGVHSQPSLAHSLLTGQQLFSACSTSTSIFSKA